ncbi:MAG: S-layer homology domain-containing protein, partial [Gemmatimonadota bacterium]|nr:S-layer homology domain-containing protein [Gemmatimonadota bacterium]
MTTTGTMLRRRLTVGATAALVAASMTLAVSAPIVAAQDIGPYPDTPAGAFYAPAVEALDQNGVFAGTLCDEGFCPNDPLDRATMAVWTVRILDGQEPPAVTSTRFPDVDATGFHAAFIERFAQLGVTRGCGDGTTFCPGAPVLRAH